MFYLSFCIWQIENLKYTAPVPFTQMQIVEIFRMVDVSSKRYNISDRHITDSPVLIFLSLVLANIRNATLPSAKLHAMDLLLAISVHMADQTKLNRILPFIVDLMHDEESIVRLSAMRTVVQLVSALFIIWINSISSLRRWTSRP